RGRGRRSPARRRGRVLVPAQSSRRVDRRPDGGVEAGVIGKTPGASRVRRARGRIRRSLIVLGNAGGSIADLALGMWRSGPAKRWLLPLAVFLCVLGLVLVLAASVEALAPFVSSTSGGMDALRALLPCPIRGR